MEERPTQKHVLMLPAWIIQAIDSLAKKRGCSANDLLAGQSQRMISDLDFLHKVELKVDEIVRLRHAGKADADAWPKDPLEALAVGLRMTLYFEDVIENYVLEVNEKDLTAWDTLTKQTGRSIEELVRDRVYGPQDACYHEKIGSADWRKKDASE
jgi:hypothetical protein